MTDVSATSLTVLSKDGVSKIYVLTPKTVIRAGRGTTAKLKVHDQVGVLATVTGNTVTATHVRDLTQLRSAHPGRAGAAPSGFGDGADVQGA